MFQIPCPLRMALVVMSLALALNGCVTLPTQAPQPPAVPAHWQAPSSLENSVGQSWLDDFQAPGLVRLVEGALRHNRDLQATAARMEAARAQARIAGAPLLPQAELGLDAARGTSASNRSPSADFGLQAQIQWEADLWGRLGDAARAAAQDAMAAERDWRAARLSLAAAVARGWFSVIETGQQLRLARHTGESFRRSLEVIEERYRRGLDSALEVRLARTDVAAADANLAARQRELDAAVRSLERLLGRYPGAALEATSELPGMRGQVPAGLPAELLARRPDLLAAEQRLSAAGERLEEARKNRLPTLSLTARGGTASEQLRDLLDWDNLVWRLLAGVVQPLFQGGRLQAEQALAKARHREAWAAYAQAVLTALSEVETALAAEARYREQEISLATATREAREAELLAEARYRQGLVDIITLLESRRRAFDAESTWLRTARERLDNRVGLYLALGGEFRVEETRDTGDGPQDQRAVPLPGARSLPARESLANADAPG
jgi:multidrug efflux system outer membrane protein